MLQEQLIGRCAAGAIGRQRIGFACLNPSKISGLCRVGLGHDLMLTRRMDLSYLPPWVEGDLRAAGDLHGHDPSKLQRR